MKRIFLSSIEDQRLETDILMDKRLAAMQVRPNDFVVRCLPQKEYSDNGYMFNQLLDHINGKVVLDIGCGDGMYSVYVLHRKARQVHAIDISKKALYGFPFD